MVGASDLIGGGQYCIYIFTLRAIVEGEYMQVPRLFHHTIWYAGWCLNPQSRTVVAVLRAIYDQLSVLYRVEGKRGELVRWEMWLGG